MHKCPFGVQEVDLVVNAREHFCNSSGISDRAISHDSNKHQVVLENTVEATIAMEMIQKEIPTPSLRLHQDVDVITY